MHKNSKSCVFGIGKSDKPVVIPSASSGPLNNLKMDLLTLLPVEIWRDHILVFIDLLDVVRASTSFLNRRVHLQFMSCIEGFMLRKASVDDNEEEKIIWCIARNIYAREVNISGDYCAQMASILPRFLTRVSKLWLSSSSVQFIASASYPRLKRLHVLVCSGESLGSLSECPCFTDLSLYVCNDISSESLLQSLSGCNQLQKCSIRGCKQIEERVITHILQNHPRLRSVDFDGRHERPYRLARILEVSDENTVFSVRNVVATAWTTACSIGMRRLAKMFPLLQKLHLEGSTSNISDQDVDILCRQCPQLIDLSLKMFRHLTSAALKSVARHLPMIEKLAVPWCAQICDAGVIAVARRCAHLNTLDISYCTNITDEAVQAVWMHCMLLTDLSLSGCGLLTDASFAPINVHNALQTLNECGTLLNGSYLQQAPLLTTLHCDAYSNSTLARHLAAQPNCIQQLTMDYALLNESDFILFSAHLPQLKTAFIYKSTVTDNVARSFVHHCPHLLYLDMTGGSAVTKEAVEELYQSYKPREFKIYS